jgi:hypothetical protein
MSLRGLSAQRPADESKAVTVTAIIQAIDKPNRVLTLKGPEVTLDVKASDQMEGFDRLKVGDEVTATYFSAVMIRAHKQGEPLETGVPKTTITKAEGTPGSETERERTFTVTVDAVDTRASSLRVKTPKGGFMTVTVSDPRQLQDLKVDDTIDLTYFESVVVRIGRPARK